MQTAVGDARCIRRLRVQWAVDATTVILILALHMISMGGLFFLIGAADAAAQAGSTCSGSVRSSSVFVYALRLALGTLADTTQGTLLDGAVILASFLFLAGLRQFMRRSGPSPAWLAAAIVVYLLLRMAAGAAFGPVGRYLLLNETLAATYLALAIAAAVESRREDPALRLPLRLLVALMSVLAVVTAARGIAIFNDGIDARYEGATAQVFYAYTSFAVVLIGPILLWNGLSCGSTGNWRSWRRTMR